MLRRCLLACGVAIAALTISTGVPEAQAPAGAVALTGVRVIDGTGRAPIENAVVVVENGRIAAVGPAASVRIPATATRVDGAGKTVVPGFVNAHGHVQVQRDSKLPVREDLLRRLRMYGAYGVTTVVGLGASEADEVAGIRLRDEQRAGTADGARLYTSGSPAAGKTPEEARQSVNRQADLKADVIKLRLNGNANDMTPETIGALIEQAHKRGLRTAIHIFNLKDARTAVDRGVDLVGHSVRDQDVDKGLIDVMKQRNTAYVPTLTRDLSVFVYESIPDFFKDPFFLRGITLYREEVEPLSTPASQQEYRTDKQAQAIKKALVQANRNLKILSDAGVAIAMGTDSGAAGNPGRWQGYFEHVEMEMMVQAGMTPMQALVASTGAAAKAWRFDQLGTIEAGKQADLVLLDANPLQDIRNTRRINAVWIGGRRVEMPRPATSSN